MFYSWYNPLYSLLTPESSPSSQVSFLSTTADTLADTVHTDLGPLESIGETGSARSVPDNGNRRRQTFYRRTKKPVRI